MGKVGKKFDYVQPDLSKPGGPVEKKTESLTPGKRGPGKPKFSFEGPDLSGGGWVNGKKGK